tara:strand:- start:96 stop:452 length:357 start_codon:yes stop_codon:yes gene_type:complete
MKARQLRYSKAPAEDQNQKSRQQHHQGWHKFPNHIRFDVAAKAGALTGFKTGLWENSFTFGRIVKNVRHLFILFRAGPKGMTPKLIWYDYVTAGIYCPKNPVRREYALIIGETVFAAV